MLLLSDCVLNIDGERIPLSRPLRADAQLRFGFSARDAERLLLRVGLNGVVQTSTGVVLLRLRVVGVDPSLNVLTAEVCRR